ncbi:MAG TPA: hypothetical protein PKA95_01900 [Thermomicrobiales bacterium]|nr:hypothetical protein [Thermomicrobiales bacterium]
MAGALATARAGGILTLEDTPLAFTCRSCGEVVLGEAPDVCPRCHARWLTFEPSPVVWYAATITPDEILRAVEENLADVQTMTAGVGEARADEGAWPLRAILEHLLGSERLLAGRAIRMLEENEPRSSRSIPTTSARATSRPRRRPRRCWRTWPRRGGRRSRGSQSSRRRPGSAPGRIRSSAA